MRKLALALVLVSTVACTSQPRYRGPLSPQRTNPAVAAVPAPIEVGGHVLSGGASWYGPGFFGNQTANGEIFTSRSMTAAHKTLPFGTLVMVSVDEPIPGRAETIVVRINDRGPFIEGRIIDLSQKAAEAVGLDIAGVLPVRLEILEWGDGKRVVPSKTREAARTSHLQAGAFSSRPRARARVEEIESLIRAKVQVVESRGLHRVVIGPLAAEDVRNTREMLASAGIEVVPTRP